MFASVPDAFPSFDPRDPAFRADPYPVYRRLREEDPVHYRPAHDDWVLTRFADVRAVLKDDRFGHAGWEPLPAFETVPADPVVRFAFQRRQSERLVKLWLLLQNPPAHTRQRQVFQPHFRSAAVRDLVPFIRRRVDDLLHRAAARGEMDLIADLAFPLPIAIICRLIGLPDEAVHPDFHRLSHELSFALDTDVDRARHVRGMMAMAQLVDYFRRLLVEHRTVLRGTDTVLGSMLRARQEGQLTETEIVANCILLFFSGHSTIQHLIGNGMLALLRHPDQLRLLRAEPERWPAAVQECLRYDGPLQLTWRTALTDARLDGRLIRKGQKVNLMIGAANHDPAFVDAPETFDVRRTPGRHVAFGRGIHYCVGAHLAPLVTAIALEAIVRRFPAIEPTGAPLTWEETFLVRGLHALPVTFSLA